MKKNEELLNELRHEFTKVWNKDNHMIDYCMKQVSNVIKLSNCMLVIFEKPSLKTSFCFGYQGDDFESANREEDYAQTNANYFIEENLKVYDRFLKEDDEWNKRIVCVGQNYTDTNIYLAHRCSMSYFEDPRNKLIKVSKEDEEMIIDAVKKEREKMLKRLTTYLKRYGLSKIDTWTYWRDE